MIGEANIKRQPWLHSLAFDLPFIIFPGFFALLITFFLPAEYKATDKTSLAGWVVLILFIDVAHVYSTLFRTYWDKRRFAKHQALYIAIPVICYIAGVLLYTINGLIFWRILAYLAVYHFIRQQYGFMRLYSRGEPRKGINSWIDTVAIYAATMYPLIYWHCTPGRNFNWFVEGDFIIGSSEVLKQVSWYAYLAIIAVYFVKEVKVAVSERKLNLPKNLVIAGTFFSWYFGIVYFNGDMVFTLLNVVAHGIPYMALIWLFRQREVGQRITSFISRKAVGYSLLFFLASIIVFAYLEEGLWDGFVWREHPEVFGIFQYLPSLHSKEALALLVPLLSLPQSTHYVLDGFIWRKEKT